MSEGVTLLTSLSSPLGPDAYSTARSSAPAWGAGARTRVVCPALLLSGLHLSSRAVPRSVYRASPREPVTHRA